MYLLYVLEGHNRSDFHHMHWLAFLTRGGFSHPKVRILIVIFLTRNLTSCRNQGGDFDWLFSLWCDDFGHSIPTHMQMFGCCNKSENVQNQRTLVTWNFLTTENIILSNNYISSTTYRALPPSNSETHSSVPFKVNMIILFKQVQITTFTILSNKFISLLRLLKCSEHEQNPINDPQV